MRPPETVYRGSRTYRGSCVVGVSVTVNGRTLDPARSQAIWNHSPDGFEWGYHGSGPAQLALALVLDATGSPHLARHVYQAFKRRTVAAWGDSWSITAGEVQEWARALLPESEGGLRCRNQIRCDAPEHCERCNGDPADEAHHVAEGGAE